MDFFWFAVYCKTHSTSNVFWASQPPTLCSKCVRKLYFSLLQFAQTINSKSLLWPSTVGCIYTAWIFHLTMWIHSWLSLNDSRCMTRDLAIALIKPSRWHFYGLSPNTFLLLFDKEFVEALLWKKVVSVFGTCLDLAHWISILHNSESHYIPITEA